MKYLLHLAVLMFFSASCVHSADKNRSNRLIAASFRIAGTSQSVDLTSDELSEFWELCSRMSVVQDRPNGVPVPHDYIFILWTENGDGVRVRSTRAFTRSGTSINWRDEERVAAQLARLAQALEARLISSNPDRGRKSPP